MESDALLTCLRALAAEQDAEHASDIATAALSQGLRHPAFHFARARWLQLNDRDAESLSELERAVALAPRDVKLLQAIGISLLRLNRPADAIAVFNSAIRIAPAEAQTHYLKGCACSATGEPASALRSHERAIALQPDHVEALAVAATANARAGNTAKARKFAEKALNVRPENPTAAIAQAMCDLQEGEFVRAETRLDKLLTVFQERDETRALALGLLGDALDGQNRPDAAFEVYSAKNQILENLYRERFGGDSRLLNRVNHLVARLDVATRSSEPEAPASSPVRQHVFLLGFMRSGTTLLEQVLAAHHEVETLEERDTLANLCPGYFARTDVPERLHLPSGDELDRARETYWHRVRAFGAKPDSKIFVEKQPFNSLYLPLIVRLFPSAKIIFLVRDPRDVILSCFRRHLEVRPTTFELLSLTSAASFYDRVMHFSELCRSKLPLDLLECRYEDIVAEFDNSVGAICVHLGMEWTDAMREFDTYARSRAIRSVSGNQVRQRLYTEGIGHWRRYERQLSRVFPRLQPWVERFGYPAS